MAKKWAEQWSSINGDHWSPLIADHWSAHFLGVPQHLSALVVVVVLVVVVLLGAGGVAGGGAGAMPVSQGSGQRRRSSC